MSIPTAEIHSIEEYNATVAFLGFHQELDIELTHLCSSHFIDLVVNVGVHLICLVHTLCSIVLLVDTCLGFFMRY